MPSYMDIEDQYLFNVYPKRPVILVRGEGARVWDDKGKVYLDCVSGHGVSNIGHGTRQVIDAITEQAQKLITCPNVFYNDARARFVKELVDITPARVTKAFLCNSGTEAIEAALKFARFSTKKSDFICAMRGFHGRSFGAMSATFKKEYRQPYEPVVPGFKFAPFNNFEKLQALVTDKTAGILLEPVQGEGGINIGDKEFFQEVQQLCRERDLLFIVDEIQTGFGRTGKMFACEHFGIEPDILCLAKAIAGGIPMGAVLCSEQIEIPIGKHGSTFGGNPLACAAASATIKFMLDNDLAKQAEEKGRYFREKMSANLPSKIREIRGPGLMIGLELKQKNQPIILDCLEKGLLVFPAGATVVRVFPPLTIAYDELDEVIDILRSVLA